MIAIFEELKGFPGESPRCLLIPSQTCIVHVLHYSIRFASWKQGRPVAMAPNHPTKSKRPRRRESGWKILTAALGGRKLGPLACAHDCPARNQRPKIGSDVFSSKSKLCTTTLLDEQMSWHWPNCCRMPL